MRKCKGRQLTISQTAASVQVGVLHSRLSGKLHKKWHKTYLTNLLESLCKYGCS